MGQVVLCAETVRHDPSDPAAQRLVETQAAIREQRRYLDSLSDPSLRAIAARTLAALEDMLLIMTRTMAITAQTRNAGAPTDAH